MAFLGKGLKIDLQMLATEMGVEDAVKLKAFQLKEAILKNKNFDEEFCKELLITIIDDRKGKEAQEIDERKRKEELEILERRRKEELEIAERKRQDEVEEKKRKDEMEFELRKKQIELKGGDESEVKESGQFRIDLHKLIQKFDSKNDDVSLFLVSFERQAKILNLSKESWVTHLISILPSDIVGLIAREPEKDAADYEYVKRLLLQRFKMSPEKFRQLFVKHQKNTEETWKDFYYEIRNFCEEWLNGLNIQTFDELKDLLIADQLKKKVPTEVREHFIDDWSKIKNPKILVEKLDEYEDIHGKTKKPAVTFSNREKSYHKPSPWNKWNPPLQSEERNIGNREGDASHKYNNFFSNNSHKTQYNRTRFAPTCFSCGKEGHTSRECRERNIRKQDSQGTKPLPVKAQSNAVQAEDNTKNVMTVRMSTLESNCNFLAQNIDKLMGIKVKCADGIFNGTVDSGAQISVVRADLVKNLESAGEGQIQLVSAFGDSEVAPLRIFNMKIDDGWHGSVPVTCAVSKKLVNEMLICQTAYEALVENVQLCSVNARQVIDDEVQCVNVAHLEVIEDQEPESYPEEEVFRETANLESKLEPNTNNETRRTFLKLQKDDTTLQDAWEKASKRDKYELEMKRRRDEWDLKQRSEEEQWGQEKLKLIERFMRRRWKREDVELGYSCEEIEPPKFGHHGESPVPETTEESLLPKFTERCEDILTTVDTQECNYQLETLFGPLDKSESTDNRAADRTLISETGDSIVPLSCSEKSVFVSGTPDIPCHVGRDSAVLEMSCPNTTATVDDDNVVEGAIIDLSGESDSPALTENHHDSAPVKLAIKKGNNRLDEDMENSSECEEIQKATPSRDNIATDGINLNSEVCPETVKCVRVIDCRSKQINLKNEEKGENVGNSITESNRVKSRRLICDSESLVKHRMSKKSFTRSRNCTIVESGPGSCVVTSDQNGLLIFNGKGKRSYICENSKISVEMNTGVYDTTSETKEGEPPPRRSRATVHDHDIIRHELLLCSVKRIDVDGNEVARLCAYSSPAFAMFPDPQKIETMSKLLRPTTKKELRGLIGLASYYRDYIKNFSSIVLPLTNLTKKKIPNKIPWDDEAEKSFQLLKENLVEMPTLYTPVLNRPYQLYTDASATIIGACLAQNDENGAEHPIAFFSKKLTQSQINWSTIEREAYAVLSALKKFDCWIFGSHIQVISDHNPLTFLTKGLPHGTKLARWALALQRYDLSITYRRGVHHGNADALSRLPFDD